MPLRSGLLSRRAKIGPPCRQADIPDHQARERIGSFEAVSEVVGVEGDDAPYSAPEVHGRRKRKRCAHGFAGQGDAGEVEILNHSYDRGTQGGLVVTGARHDVGPSHPGEVQRVHGEWFDGSAV